MAITREQLLNLGFKKIKRNHLNSTHNTLLLPLNSTDYLFSGYDKVTKKTNFKIIWISRKITDLGRITQPLDNMGDLTYFGLKKYIERLNKQEQLKQDARNYK